MKRQKQEQTQSARQPLSSRLLQEESLLRPGSHNRTHKHKKARDPQPSYEDIASFRILKSLKCHEEHLVTLARFLSNRATNILFVFGPSGCGKTLLVEDTLTTNSIPFSRAAARIRESEQGDVVFGDIFVQLSQALRRTGNPLNQDVTIFKEFPLPMSECGSDYLSKYRRFRETVFQDIQACESGRKTIFVLDTEIYSPFYLLNEGSSEHCLSRLPNVMVIKMEAYSNRDMKILVTHFLEAHPLYMSVAQPGHPLDDLLIQANGNASRILHLVYQRKVEEIAAEERQRLQWEMDDFSQGMTRKRGLQQLQEEHRVPVFHMLGKFLYGKRRNHLYEPGGRQKDKQISTYYSEEQIRDLDPKFYFNPVSLLQRSGMTLAVFAELLHANFLFRFGKAADAVRMEAIFRDFDSYLVGSLNRSQVMREMQTVLTELLTWGVLICNRNSNRDGKLFKIQRSRNGTVQQFVTKKKEILRNYYTKTPEGGRYRISDVVAYGHWSRSNRARLDYAPLHQKLVELVYHNARGRNSEVETHLGVIQDEDEDIARDSCGSLTKLEGLIEWELQRKGQLGARIQAIMADSDESDIDVQSEN